MAGSVLIAVESTNPNASDRRATMNPGATLMVSPAAARGSVVEIFMALDYAKIGTIILQTCHIIT
jgi:hypothetical protein